VELLFCKVHFSKSTTIVDFVFKTLNILKTKSTKKPPFGGLIDLFLLSLRRLFEIN